MTPPRRFRPAFSSLLPATLSVLLAAPGAWAQDAPAPAAAGAPDELAAAREPATGDAADNPRVARALDHYRRARAHYERGAYRRAIAELERALQLDPQGKDLVFNLGLLHEKLGHIDQAIIYFSRYQEMEPDAELRARADAIVVRLRGAKRELAMPVPSRPAAGTPPRRAAAAEHLKLDAWQVAPAAVAAGALLVGTYFGVRALVLQSSARESTGGGTSAADLHDRADAADRSALTADVAFTLSLASAAVAVGVYWTRRSAVSAPVRALSTPWELRF